MSRLDTRPVLLVRPADRNAADLLALSRLHINADVDPYLTVDASRDPDAAKRAHALLAFLRDEADWFIATSLNAVEAVAALTSKQAFQDGLRAARDRGARCAAVGRATANALHQHGLMTVHLPGVATANGLADFLLATTPPKAVALPQGNQALHTLPVRLHDAGVAVHKAVVYETKTVPHTPRTLARLQAGEYAVVVLRSPTAVRALHQYSPNLPATTTLVCGGPTTTAEAKRLFAAPIVDSVASDPDTVAAAVATALARQPKG